MALRRRVGQRVYSGNEIQVIKVLIGTDQPGNAVILHNRRVDAIPWFQPCGAMSIEQVNGQANVGLCYG